MQDNLKILVTIPANESHKQQLTAAAPGAEFTYLPAEMVSDAALQKATVILGNLPPQRLAAAKNLVWMQLNSAGSDAFAAALPSGVQLTNATGAYGLALSEYMLAVTFSLCKKLMLYRDDQRASRWQDEGSVFAIEGSTVLVLGLGDIGGDYARKMRALGAHVIGIRRHKTALPEYLDELGSMEQLEEFLPRADIVAMSLPGGAATTHVMNAARFAKMKPGSILVNVGRGTAVDQMALLNALQCGKLSGAALDVTDPEPLPADSPLWQCKNCIITPHTAGDFHLPQTLDRIVGIMADNLAAFCAGQPLKNVVDRKSGYRTFCG